MGRARAQPESGAAAVFTVFPPAMEVRAASSADFSAAFQLSVELRYFYDAIDYYVQRRDADIPALQPRRCATSTRWYASAATLSTQPQPRTASAR